MNYKRLADACRSFPYVSTWTLRPYRRLDSQLPLRWRSPKNPNGLTPKTVRSIWNVMKLTFKFGVEWGCLNENPMGEKRVELPRGSTKRIKHSVQLTAAEFFRILGLLERREQLAVAFAGWLGPRVSEIFG